MRYTGPLQDATPSGRPEGWQWSYADAIYERALAGATTVADVENRYQVDPALWQPEDYVAFHDRWPDHARVYTPPWMPLFCGACDVFGMETALTTMCTRPEVFEAFVALQHGAYMDILSRGLAAARDHCDICWLGDDYASKDALLMGRDLWRKLIMPRLAQHVRLAREHGMAVLFHSCGAVREILPDLIDMGVSALNVFQTKATGMQAASIARDFGGRLAFYGGIDCQHLLTFGTPEDVGREVRANVQAFQACGGYVVANSHHCIANIQGANIVAMCEAVKELG